MAIDMSQFYQVFFEESAEHLAAMEALLLELDVDAPDPEDLNAIFRAAHSIKGSAGTFGFKDLADVTHLLENLLDRIRKQELRLRPDMVDAFLETGDLLKAMLAAHQGQAPVDPATVAGQCDKLRNLAAAVTAAPPTPSAIPAAKAPPDTGADVGQGAETREYHIQFVPTAASAVGEGVAHFLQDLQELGVLGILAEPEAGAGGVGLWRLRLTTGAGREAFEEQLDFISESGAWRIEEAAAAEPDAFGIFADAPGAPAEEAYGFFEPLGAAPGNVAPATPAAEEGEGCGFFVPLPVPATTAPAVSTGGEEGDGYGFFAPLPPLPATPPPAAMPGDTGRGPGATGRPKAAVAGDSSIRVGVEKVDQLINLVGELVITQAMLLQTAAHMNIPVPERLATGLAQLERNTRDLQEAVMSIRMMPISAVFSRFPRVVRDLSGKLGKQVELKTSGETTELDKSLIERIADPLTHLIRNSLDHGIETPEKRAAVGKQAVGIITLKAYHQGGNVVIEVGDDGAGLDRQKILAKARERSLPVSDQMTDGEVFALIFEAGFSTAEQVTDVSGRGVGMDVVRRNIQSMGGRVEIESMAGIGTRMTVRLPLTLAILDGMSVAVGDQTYILPLASVVESLQPRHGDIKTLANQGRVVQVRGDYLPVVVLGEFFNLPAAGGGFAEGIMVILDADGAKAALFVDALLGQHQVVIKSLEANYRRVAGVSGATIMGDGHVALILDVPALVGCARSTMQKAA